MLNFCFFTFISYGMIGICKMLFSKNKGKFKKTS
jgi:hypothetical protein